MAEVDRHRFSALLRGGPPQLEQTVSEHSLRDVISKIIPQRFQSVTLASYDPRTPSQKAALEAVREWVGHTSDGMMLALIGSTGTGKSHLLYAAARGLMAMGKSVYARPWYRLVDQLRFGSPITTESGGRIRESAEVRADWWERRIVLLDEVRPTSGTDFDALGMAKFSCHAYDHCRHVLITTNTPLVELMGAPAASRYMQIIVDGPDGRGA